jgi:hypothetical protein
MVVGTIVRALLELPTFCFRSQGHHGLEQISVGTLLQQMMYGRKDSDYTR